PGFAISEHGHLHRSRSRRALSLGFAPVENDRKVRALSARLRYAKLKTYPKSQEGRSTMSASSLAAKWSASAPELRSVLRIVAAPVFMPPGSMKPSPSPAGVPPNGGTVPLVSQFGLGGVLEVFGGALLVLGLFTRPVAFVLAGEMAVAYFQFHFPQSFWPTINNGVAAVIYSFLWLYFSAAGPGPW